MSFAAPAIRPEVAADRAAVHTLNCAAFGRDAEARLVDALRDEGAIVLSLVAEEDGCVIGHVLYSRLTLEPDRRGISALAPVAVVPERQKQGLAARLIEEAHARLAAQGEKLVLVVGDPSYYRRFGFSVDAAKAFRTPYDGPYLMALALSADAPQSGTVAYPAPFARLG